MEMMRHAVQIKNLGHVSVKFMWLLLIVTDVMRHAVQIMNLGHVSVKVMWLLLIVRI
jgi:hypothetical protein